MFRRYRWMRSWTLRDQDRALMLGGWSHHVRARLSVAQARNWRWRLGWLGVPSLWDSLAVFAGTSHSRRVLAYWRSSDGTTKGPRSLSAKKEIVAIALLSHEDVTRFGSMLSQVYR